MDDYELLKRTASGDEEAFAVLVRRYQQRLLRYCYRFLRDVHLAEDVVQEVFVRVYKFAPSYVPKGSVASFLYRVAANCCLDVLKQKRRRNENMPTVSFSVVACPSGELRSMDTMIASRDKPPEAILMHKEAMESFTYAVKQLPDNHRNALLYFEIEGLSYNEIAELMASSLSEVKIWIYRARKKLAKLLAKENDNNKGS